MRKIIFSFLLISLFFSCEEEKKSSLKSGMWRAELQVSSNEVLPFNFQIISQDSLTIFNGEEQILITDISYDNDSLVFKAPVFEGYIKAEWNAEYMEGEFVKESLDRVVPFSAEFGKETRFDVKTSASDENVSGNWEVVFSPDSEEDRYIAKGIFKQDGQIVTGTFRTTTGDYRYLEGVVDGNILKLSAFDGAHAFLFTAEVTDSTMVGMFYSGNHWKEPFSAKRNDSFELPNANELTYIKVGYETLEFSFPDAEGNMVSLKDDRFKDKAVVVQVMGTWCPNCLDESRYYSEFYNSKPNKNFEIVALAFEYAKTEAKAFESIKRLQNDVGISYPILLVQYGSSSKRKAQEKLPMLNHVLSYPTSIFIDKKGKVRKIHTGFNGPATGEKFVEFKAEFSAFIQLLSEE